MRTVHRLLIIISILNVSRLEICLETVEIRTLNLIVVMRLGLLIMMLLLVRMVLFLRLNRSILLNVEDRAFRMGLSLSALLWIGIFDVGTVVEVELLVLFHFRC